MDYKYIRVSYSTWKKLTNLKINKRLATYDQVIAKLIKSGGI